MKAGCGKTARPVWAADGGKPKNGASSDPTPLEGKRQHNSARGKGPCFVHATNEWRIKEIVQ